MKKEKTPFQERDLRKRLNRALKKKQELNNRIMKAIADIEDIREKNTYYDDYKVDSSILTYWISILRGSDK